GIKTILNLRTVSANELETLGKIAEENGLKYINIPLNPFRIKKSFPFILDTINSASKENPLFIHCTYGKDRTGFVSALVNYMKNGMSMKDAVKDMTAHGSTNPIFLNLKRFLYEFDRKSKNFH
ncbi:tyrosine-protein phosphatase, partial [bacterium]|nr:tyrosine-protein phosphatase [bacterium]